MYGPPGVQIHCRPSIGCASQCQEQIQKMDQASPPASAGDTGSIPRSGRSPGEGNGNPLQCSYLENPRDRGIWWASVYGVTQSRTQLKRLSSSSSSYILEGRVGRKEKKNTKPINL